MFSFVKIVIRVNLVRDKSFIGVEREKKLERMINLEKKEEKKKYL
jgi:tRNA(Ser,Leu) C12 N-acetylase TAN1